MQEIQADPLEPGGPVGSSNPRPDELDDGREGDARFAAVGLRCEDRAATCPDAIGQPCAETSLPDPRLTLDQQEPAVRPCGLVTREEGGELLVTANEGAHERRPNQR